MEQGNSLRLSQQMLSREVQPLRTCSHLRQGWRGYDFHTKFAVQLNDTHPAIAVAELMSVLMDGARRGLGHTAGSINHQASAKHHSHLFRGAGTWEWILFERLAAAANCRYYEINSAFCAWFHRIRPTRGLLGEEMSADVGGRSAQGAHATWRWLGSHHGPNGVAELTATGASQPWFAEFPGSWPCALRNVTNGVQRKALECRGQTSPRLLDEAIGGNWRRDAGRIAAPLNRSPTSSFHGALCIPFGATRANSAWRTSIIRTWGVGGSLSLFDVQ